MSSSCCSSARTAKHVMKKRTRLRPSTHPLIHPRTPKPPRNPPANSSIPLGKYPIVASGLSRASLACSQTRMEDGVGECGVCGYDPWMSISLSRKRKIANSPDPRRVALSDYLPHLTQSPCAEPKLSVTMSTSRYWHLRWMQDVFDSMEWAWYWYVKGV